MVGRAELRVYRFAAQQPLVEKLRVPFLDGRGVGQHRMAQIGGPWAGVDGPPESVLHQQRKIAAVIDVRVREHHRRDILAGKRKAPVPLFGFFTPSLILAAIQQVAFVLDRQLMHRPGDGLRRAPEGYFHSSSEYRLSFTSVSEIDCCSRRSMAGSLPTA